MLWHYVLSDDLVISEGYHASVQIFFSSEVSDNHLKIEFTRFLVSAKEVSMSKLFIFSLTFWQSDLPFKLTEISMI